MSSRFSFSHRIIKPERILALGFLAAILIGAALLSLPQAGADGRCIGLTKALFTATSAVCVTGLTLIDAGTQLSGFGQGILLLLIQTGGLGFMTFATLIMVALGKRVSLRGRILLRDSMNQTTLGGMVRLSISFFSLAFVIELCGSLLLMTRLVPLYGTGKGIWYSIFTSISAFCNAGFDLFGGYRSLTLLNGEPIVLLTLCMLITLGSLGFTVILECLQQRFRFRQLSLHARLVLLLTCGLTLFGMLCIWGLEHSNPATLKTMPVTDQMFNSLFQSITLRTAGFASLDQAALTDASKLFGCLYMFIGASSASTGGGIKTTTALMLVLLVISVIRGRERIVVFGRELSADTARRSMAIAFIGMLVVLTGTIAVSVIERSSGAAFIDLLYETVSAFSTTGLSAANTPSLSSATHFLLMPLMYLGRVGPLTLAFALASRADSSTAARVRYPEEKVMIG